jgi:hypothetical protein
MKRLTSGLTVTGAFFLFAMSHAYAATIQAVDPWDQVVSTAKKEGRVSVIGPQGVDTRSALTDGFQKGYAEIQIE